NRSCDLKLLGTELGFINGGAGRETPASFPDRIGYPSDYRSDPVQQARRNSPLLQASQKILRGIQSAHDGPFHGHTHHSGPQGILLVSKGWLVPAVGTELAQDIK